jgi:hypothetical protein
VVNSSGFQDDDLTLAVLVNEETARDSEEHRAAADSMPCLALR